VLVVLAGTEELLVCCVSTLLVEDVDRALFRLRLGRINPVEERSKFLNMGVVNSVRNANVYS
jgi:hypothetical protein